jgi:HlyD family secretion protein
MEQIAVEQIAIKPQRTPIVLPNPAKQTNILAPEPVGQTKKKNKKYVYVGALIVLLVIGGGVWWWFASKEANTLKYKLVKIERGTVSSIITSTGVVNPVYTVQVGSQVSGTIVRLFTDFNQKVRKGQLIALIDTTTFAAAVRDARASVARTVAQRTFAEGEYRRAQELMKTESNSRTELDQAKLNLETATADAISGRALLDKARINLTFAFIRSPIDGTVISRNVDVGQTVAASLSAPTIFAIANDLTQMQILANVDESDIGQIQQGQTVRFTVQAYPDKQFGGTVMQIRLQPATIQNVVNYSVVVATTNKDGYLLPGMTATVEFQILTVPNALKIPNAAIRFHSTPEMMSEARSNMLADPTTPDSVKAALNKSSAQSGQQRSNSTASSTKPRNAVTLWYLDSKGLLKMARARLGISDGQSTEIRLPESSPLKEGMEIIVGTTVVGQSGQAPSASPLRQTQPQGGAPRGF